MKRRLSNLFGRSAANQSPSHEAKPGDVTSLTTQESDDESGEEAEMQDLKRSFPDNGSRDDGDGKGPGGAGAIPRPLKLRMNSTSTSSDQVCLYLYYISVLFVRI